jgi:hypothetical protein
MPTVSLFVLVKKNASFWTVLIGRNALPVLFGNFYLFGFHKYFALKFGLANDKIP